MSTSLVLSVLVQRSQLNSRTQSEERPCASRQEERRKRSNRPAHLRPCLGVGLDSDSVGSARKVFVSMTLMLLPLPLSLHYLLRARRFLSTSLSSPSSPPTIISCIYRVIELAQGWTGYLITHQPFFWGLDTIPMVSILAIGLAGQLDSVRSLILNPLRCRFSAKASSSSPFLPCAFPTTLHCRPRMISRSRRRRLLSPNQSERRRDDRSLELLELDNLQDSVMHTSVPTSRAGQLVLLLPLLALRRMSAEVRQRQLRGDRKDEPELQESQ